MDQGKAEEGEAVIYRCCILAPAVWKQAGTLRHDKGCKLLRLAKR